MQELIQRLEAAILRRNPALGQSFQPGLAVAKIKKELTKAGIAENIDTLTALYSWKNGCVLQGFTDEFKKGLEGGFVPPVFVPLSEEKKLLMRRMGFKHEGKSETFHFLQLRTAIVTFKSFGEYAKPQPRLAVLVGRYLPVLWDGSTTNLALDVGTSGASSVVKIEIAEDRDPHVLRKAYASFEDFLRDAIRANEENQPLRCVTHPGEPIIPSASVEKAPTEAADEPPADDAIFAVRTDFSDEPAWASLRSKLQERAEDACKIAFIDAPANADVTPKKLSSVLPNKYPLSFALVIDKTALTHPEHPILVVDLNHRSRRSFRAVVSALAVVASNLSIANMGFEEFIALADADGIFRYLL